LENKSEIEKTYATSLKMTVTSTLEKPYVFIQEKKESKVEVNQKPESIILEKKLEKTSQEITKSKETLSEEKNKKQEIKNESLEKAKEETLKEKSQKEQNKLKASKNLTKILPIFLLLLILLFIIYKRSR
jgi:thiol:disulfide interchange protein